MHSTAVPSRRVRRSRPGRGARRPRLPLLLLALPLLAAVWLLLFRPGREPAPAAPDWVRQDLLPINEWSRPGDRLDGVNGVVIHYTGNPGTSAQQNRDYFAGLAKTHETYASSNFVVGLDGEVLQAVPSGEVAYASSQRNHDTLSIEVCHPDETGVFRQPTYDTLVRLVQWLVERYGLGRDQILRHYDVTGKECPRWFVEDPDAWEAFLDRLDFTKSGA